MTYSPKDLLAREALAQIPKILTLQDRNRHSPTYGCFDRNYWHYRIIDFPSGMAQEFVLPLALAYGANLPENPFFQKPAIREWVLAGIRYAARAAHSDGSCDDYFPYERAGGAAAFSLLACMESYRLLAFDDIECRDFFAKRADWLAAHQESGRLSNHQALIALCLELAGDILGTDRWSEKASARVDQVLSWQTDEGWFWEYEGCDPGYLTLTISVLAWLHDFRPVAPYAETVAEALRNAVDFAANFVHPDGSFGGEYASRNTYNFFPAGFELVGRWYPAALSVNDRFLSGLAAGLAPCYADDHIVGHHTWNYLLAWRDFAEERPPVDPAKSARSWFPIARLLIQRRGDKTLYVALNKGGVFKLFQGDQLVASDTQFSLLTTDGRNAVGHLVGSYDIVLEDDEVSVGGKLGWAKQKRMTTFSLLVLRLLMLAGGRLFPNLIRRILQKLLITGKDSALYDFKRRFVWLGDQLTVEDELSAKDWGNVGSLAIGCDQTSIYVVMSRTFQSGQMLDWTDLTERMKALKPDQKLHLSRLF